MDKVKEQQAKSKKHSEQIVDFEQRNFRAGVYRDPPASEIPDEAIVKANDCKVFPEWIEGRTGTELWSSTDLPTLPGRDNYEATKVGNVITKTVGDSFTADDVDSYFIWPDGVHENITEYVDFNTVIVGPTEQHAPATASNPGKIRGPVNAWYFHRGQRIICLHIDTRVFYTDINFSAYTEVIRRSGVAPLSDASNMSEHGDFVYLFNANGIFKISLDSLPIVMWQANAEVPENTITDVPATDDKVYGRRYLYGLSILSGSGARDRRSPGVEILWEGGVNAPDPDREYKDYREVFRENEDPQSSYGSHDILTGGATTKTLGEFSAISLGGAQFEINGVPKLLSFNLGGVTDFDHLARHMQSTIRSGFSDDTIEFLWDTDHFVLKSGQIAGSTVGYVSAGAHGVNIGDDDYLNMRDPGAGGNGVISAESFSVNGAIGPLTNPTGQQQGTHYTVYGTKDTGVNGTLNDPNDYIWLADIPMIKSFTASRDGAGVISASDGAFTQSDVGSTIEFADTTTDLIQHIITPTQAQGSAGVISSQSAAIGAATMMKALQTGYQVTRQTGDSFALADVGKTMFWANGFQSTISEFLNANNVIVAESAEYLAQGVAFNPTTRDYNDVISDETIEARYSSWLLAHRFWIQMPIINVGIIVPGFMFTGIRGDNTIFYTALPIGKEYLAGYYVPAYQYEILDDALSFFGDFPDMCIIICSRSTKRISVNVSTTVVIPNTNTKVTTISGITNIDSEIGSTDMGAFQVTEEGQAINFTSEPGIRLFDGFKYGPNLGIDGEGRGYIMNDLRKLQSAVASSYDPIEGYLLWGTDQEI